MNSGEWVVERSRVIRADARRRGQQSGPMTSSSAPAAIVTAEAAAPMGGPPRVDGKFLRVNGERFWVKGVTYGTFGKNSEGEPYPEIWRVREDFAAMRDAGVNTVRLYTPPSDGLADAAADAGLMLIPDVCWGPRFCEIHRREDLGPIYEWTRAHARRLSRHPAVLMYSIGNEIPPLLVRWYGRRHIERFLAALDEIVKTEAPGALTTYACHPPTEHLHLPFLDVVSFNVYLERERDFRRYLARLQNLAGERPLLLSEIGLDSNGAAGGAARGAEAQAELLDWQLRATFEKGLCGATVYSWTDEWSIFAEDIGGWSFGLTDHDRRPKPALEAVRRIYRSERRALRAAPWPRASVVVCSYNGGRTLERCLRSVTHLNYPDYEVIVIDDGSTDATSAVAARFPVRCLRTENGGLSRARNLGIAESTGDVVAFIDADAYADPDWLSQLVTALDEQGAAAAGGPNFCPRDDGFVADCVDHAPGNPTHVLVSDELAEHVPGCNMAFRKDALRAVGGFDAVHRTAGDDVDVCWKLLARGMKIAYAPGGFVWHHRRPTVRAFLRQQKGYGYAESFLRRRYPSRFNVFGYAVWSGGIYDGVHHGLRMDGLPRLLRPRVYQGRFGGAQFQSLYQPFHAWWFQIFTTFEFQGLALFTAAGAAVALASGQRHASVALLAVTAVLVATTLAAAGAAGWHAARAKRWRGPSAVAGITLVAALHVLQPLSRAAGRLKGWWHGKLRGERFDFPAEQKLWGNLSQRDRWLERLVSHARACGWRADAGDDWADADVVVSGPGPCRVELRSVAEERLEKNYYFVRYRVAARLKPSAVLLGLGLLGAFAAVATRPALWPLAVPLLAVLRVMSAAPRVMTAAVSQMALEIAEAERMPKVVEEGC